MLARAQYPLQWLGEHLIQQSILFEGNPDSTNIRERFVYRHEISSATGQAQSDGQAATSAIPQPQEVSSQSWPEATAESQPEASATGEQNHQNLEARPVATVNEAVDAPVQDLPTTTGVNGAVGPSEGEQNQDTEMSNTT